MIEALTSMPLLNNCHLIKIDPTGAVETLIQATHGNFFTSRLPTLYLGLTSFNSFLNDSPPISMSRFVAQTIPPFVFHQFQWPYRPCITFAQATTIFIPLLHHSLGHHQRYTRQTLIYFERLYIGCTNDLQSLK